mmetsp:Transcript_50137/g.98126  ORF Transcript_50137/g.98126 Transcript_50137/m.98126 type:complete len:311 (+) Transcript_50137:851-1783(+)
MHRLRRARRDLRVLRGWGDARRNRGLRQGGTPVRQGYRRRGGGRCRHDGLHTRGTGRHSRQRRALRGRGGGQDHRDRDLPDMQPASGRHGDRLDRPDLRGDQAQLQRRPGHLGTRGGPRGGRHEKIHRNARATGQDAGGHHLRREHGLLAAALRLGTVRRLRADARHHHPGEPGVLPSALLARVAAERDGILLPLRVAGAGGRHAVVPAESAGGKRHRGRRLSTRRVLAPEERLRLLRHFRKRTRQGAREAPRRGAVEPRQREGVPVQFSRVTGRPQAFPQLPGLPLEHYDVPLQKPRRRLREGPCGNPV